MSKGAHPRPLSIPRKEYREKYDKIFPPKKAKKPSK